MRPLWRLFTIAAVLLALHVAGAIEIRWPQAARDLADEARGRTHGWVSDRGPPLPFDGRTSQSSEGLP